MEASQILAVPRVARWRVSPQFRLALILVGIWSIPGLLLATSMYAASALYGDELTFAEALLWRMPEWQVWALATPLIVVLGRRFPPWRQPLVNVPIHLVVAMIIAIVDIVVYWASGQLVGQQPFASKALMDLLPMMLLKTAFFELLVYATVICVDQGMQSQRRYRQSVLEKSQLEARLASTQLQALKMQLHPHFLFNTINAITVLMRKGDGAAAVRMLTGLGELLRRSLTSMKVELVSLHEELDFIERYLDIERTRFPDRLRVMYDVPPETKGALVPSMILQPLVENAIEHGISPRTSGGRISIVARREIDRLVVEIRDDGAGLARNVDDARSFDGLSKGHGVGLSHVRKRLAQLYPDRHRFTLEAGAPSGAVARLEIPFTEEESAS